MDENVIEVFGKWGSIGGLALAVLLFLFREVIRKSIFPTLTKEQAYRILLMILLLVSLITLASIVAFVYIKSNGFNTKHRDENSQEKKSEVVTGKDSSKERAQSERIDTRTDVKPDLSKSQKEVYPKHPKHNRKTPTFYTVELLVPSTMSKAMIFVDGLLADVLDETLQLKTIRVEESDSAHEILVTNGKDTCTQRILIKENGMRLTPCQ